MDTADNGTGSCLHACLCKEGERKQVSNPPNYNMYCTRCLLLVEIKLSYAEQTWTKYSATQKTFVFHVHHPLLVSCLFVFIPSVVRFLYILHSLFAFLINVIKCNFMY